MTGSFKPIDEGEWSDQVYVKPTQQLFTAIAAHDREMVKQLLGNGIDVNDRDHVGRTSLHVAIISKAVDIAGDLIEAGARITARLADGRAPLHLAAQYGQVSVVHKLLEKSKKNAEEAEKKNGRVKDDDAMEEEVPDRPSSEDDWSSHDEEDVVMSDVDDEEEEEEDSDEDEDERGKRRRKDKGAEEPQHKTNGDTGDIPEEEEDQPDIITIDESDWDFGLSALGFAILFASLPTVDAFLDAGSDVKTVMKSTNGPALHPLSLTIVREDEDAACRIAERLLKAGASSTTANENVRTIFHAAVYAGRTKLVETFLRHDPNAATAVNFPAILRQNVIFPIVTAINKKHYGLLAILLAHDARLEFEEEDISRAQEAA